MTYFENHFIRWSWPLLRSAISYVLVICLFCSSSSIALAASTNFFPQDNSKTETEATGNPIELPTPSVGSYVLGPGDQISIENPAEGIEGVPLTTTANVLPDGTISIYPVGLLEAKGKTLGALEKEVNEKAANIIKSPEFVLSLIAARPATVYVLGYVLNPGRYNNNSGSKDKSNANSSSGNPSTTGASGGAAARRFGPYNSTRSYTGANLTGKVALTVTPQTLDVLTVLTAIQLAGGVRESADIRHINLRRKGSSQTRTVDLWKLLVEGFDTQDILLQDGDTVFIPKGGSAFQAELLGTAADRSRPVKVFGAVQNPGVYNLAPADDMLSIISRAGGFLSTAQMQSVILSRMNREGQIETRRVSIAKSMKNNSYSGRVPVHPGDIVQVQYSYVKRMGPRVATYTATFVGAFMILYLSRLIIDQSQPATQQ